MTTLTPAAKKAQEAKHAATRAKIDAAKDAAAKVNAEKAAKRATTRDVTPKTDSLASVVPMTGRTKKAAPAKKAAPKAAAKVSRPAPSGDTMKCRVCAETLPVTKFPTTPKDKDGNVGRDDRCRSCRDAQKKSRSR